MSKILTTGGLILTLCLIAAGAVADYLQVRRDTLLRERPNREAPAITAVRKGDLLPLLNEGRQDNGWYNVQPGTPGRTAWIYRSLVRRWYGQMPVPVPDEDDPDPLRDASWFITPEQKRFARRHLRLGKPQAVYERVRQGYVAAQDGRLKIPLWVQYEIDPEELNGPVARTNAFQSDTSVPDSYRAENSDYEGSGYDKGHMTPAKDMNRSHRTMAESFLLTNMAPQVGVGFNRHLWKDLEVTIRGWVEQRGTLTIITGPIFSVKQSRVTYEVIGDGNVAVPTHFYKIVIDANNIDQVETLAFIIPNKAQTVYHLPDFLSSIDEIESATGLNFLSALPADQQAHIEALAAERIW